MDTMTLMLLLISQADALAADDELIATQATQLAATDNLIEALETAIHEYETTLTKLYL